MAAFEGVRTWADGFGIWHARVPRELTGDAEVARIIARGAIMAELALRNMDLAPSAVVLAARVDNSGEHHYAEATGGPCVPAK